MKNKTRKTWKQPYRKSRRFDKTCRCNGGCPYCYSNRMHKTKKKLYRLKQQLKEYANDFVPKINPMFDRTWSIEDEADALEFYEFVSGSIKSI